MLSAMSEAKVTALCAFVAFCCCVLLVAGADWGGSETRGAGAEGTEEKVVTPKHSDADSH